MTEKQRRDTLSIVPVHEDMGVPLSGRTPTQDYMLSNLQSRYHRHLLYTRIGSNVLISMNPYKEIPAISELIHPVEMANAANPVNPPSLEDFALGAWWHMHKEGKNQTFIARGESGSGKTEATKRILQQICRLSSRSAAGRNRVHSQVKKASLVLEAFGNASTLLNPNSSRHGRYTELQFNEEGHMVGAKTIECLLERGRCTAPPDQERNFHVLYALVAGATSEEKSKWRLQDASKFASLTGSKLHEADDADIMAKLRKYLHSLGFTKRTQRYVFRTLAAILHIGNIQFVEAEKADSPAEIQNKAQLQFVASILQVHPDALEVALTTRTSLIGEDICSEFLRPVHAMRIRDHMACALYGLLFSWIVECINTRLVDDAGAKNYIALLDIPGFENCALNGLHQFATNFMSERIRAHSAETLVARQRSLLEQEGLSGPAVQDYESKYWACARLYMDDTKGLISLLDAQTPGNGSKFSFQRIEGGTETSMLESFHEHHGDKGEGNYLPAVTNFGIRHYLGPVNYDCHAFLDANANAVSADLVKLFRGAGGQGTRKPPFASVLFTDATLDTDRHAPRENVIVAARQSFSRRRPSCPMEFFDKVPPNTEAVNAAEQSLAISPPLQTPRPERTLVSQLQRSMEDLCQALRTTSEWHIICIKPNDRHKANHFDFQKVLSQVVGHGLIDLVRLKQVARWSVQMTFTEFHQRYSQLLQPKPESDLACMEVRNGADSPGHEEIVNEIGSADKCLAQKLIQDEGWAPHEAMIGQRSVLVGEQLWRNLEGRLSKVQEPFRCEQWIEHNNQKPTDDFDAASIASNTSGTYSDSDMESVAVSEDEYERQGGKGGHIRVDVDLEKGGTEAGSPKVVISDTSAVPQKRLSGSRRCWLCIVWMNTFWIPSWALRLVGKIKRLDAQLAWREKVTIFALTMWMSAIMLFVVVGIPQLVCPRDKIYSRQEIAGRTGDRGEVWMSWNGIVYDMSYFIHPRGAMNMFSFAGSDVSGYFPRNGVSECIGLRNETSTSTAMCSVQGINGTCHHTQEVRQKILNRTINIYPKGEVGFSEVELSQHAALDNAFTSLDGKVYDVTNIILSNGSNFPDSVVGILEAYRGRKADKRWEDLAPYVNCLNAAYLVGVMDDRKGLQCAVTSNIILAITGFLVAIMVFKLFAALQLLSKGVPQEPDKFCLLLIPCYTEGEKSLRKAIDSLALLTYDDRRKLLFVVADGMIRGSGNEKSTPEIVLDILGVPKEERLQVYGHSYKAIGIGSAQHNKAKVYAGLYTVEGRNVPYLVVVKCGKESETNRPGHRGKRDSQMIFMSFLNKVHHQSPMTPLELEIYSQMKNVIGVDPHNYEYCLMVDADTEVLPDALSQMVSHMLHDTRTMAICGETLITNEKRSWVTMIQVFDYASQHLGKAFESMFGNVTCLPGCFSMYRIRTSAKGMPLLSAPEVIGEYSENHVDTLHKKNLLMLGEDRYLTTLLLRHFPDHKVKFTPFAKCRTVVPEKWTVLLSQRRRWINSTVHNLYELLLVPQLCGFFCCSMRFIVFLELVATLIMPASVAYFVFLIYEAVNDATVPQYALIMLAAVYGCQVLVFGLKKEWRQLGWMAIYILAMPIFGFFLPLYSFWHFDDFSWGNTRVVAGASAASKGSGRNGSLTQLDEFDVSEIPSRTWTEHEASTTRNQTLKTATSVKTKLNQLKITTSADSLRHAPYTRSSSSACSLSGGIGYGSLEASSTQASTANLFRGGVPQPSDEVLVQEVRSLLAQADLNKVTKRSVRDELTRRFEVDLDSRRHFINRTIEAVVQGKL